jgi:Ca2+-binding EF-hand superfamily protein
MRTLLTPISLAGLLVLFTSADAFGQGPGGGGGRDPGRYFDYFAKGRPSVPVSELATNPRFAEVAKYAQANGLTQIDRQSFANFFQMRLQQKQSAQSGGPGNGGQGRPGADDPERQKRRAERGFQRMDLNNDGYLDSSEVAPAVWSAMVKYDQDGDGKISLNEYIRYTEARAQQPGGKAESQAEEQYEVRVVPRAEPARKVVVYRAGKLPKGLPGWFTELDTDKDGQVSLYEWRMGNKDLNEFTQMDRNNDGFLTAEEVLRHQRLAQGKAGSGSSESQTASANAQAGAAAGPQGRGPGMGRFRGRNRQQAQDDGFE